MSILELVSVSFVNLAGLCAEAVFIWGDKAISTRCSLMNTILEFIYKIVHGTRIVWSFAGSCVRAGVFSEGVALQWRLRNLGLETVCFCFKQNVFLKWVYPWQDLLLNAEIERYILLTWKTSLGTKGKGTRMRTHASQPVSQRHMTLYSWTMLCEWGSVSDASELRMMLPCYVLMYEK